MAKKKQKRERVPVSPNLVMAVVLFMASIFVIQTLFPENFGAFLRKEVGAGHTVSVTVTGGKSASYTTEDTADIEALLSWSDGWKMRHRTLADTMDFTGQTKTEYSIAITRFDGTYGGMVIDEAGFVQIGSGVYQIAGDTAAFLTELEALLQGW